MPPDSEPHALAPRLPYSLGRFTLCKELGSGGMATVYLSKMRLGGKLDRLVALKTIHQHLAKERTFVDMFLDEARIASQISHPNVCAVYDFGDVDGVYFLAMEYLVGEPLFDVINRIVAERSQDLLKALPYIAARIIADACEGLQAAHDLKGTDGSHLGVVHRDVSPQNLFITYEGAVKVVDFGCAKAVERVTQTGTGMMKGKISYASPEQFGTDEFGAEEVDARADVFALGICLWETLTLRQLFRRDTAIQTAKAVLEEPIPRATSGAPWVPKELADIAQKALNRDPGRRYQSARELGRDLRNFVARTGTPFEAAELSDWIKHLFRDRHDEVLEAVAEAEAMEITPSMLAPPMTPDTVRPPRLASSRAPLQAAAEGSARRERAPLLRLEDARGPSVPPKNTGRTLAVVAALALAAGGAYAGFRALNAPHVAAAPVEQTESVAAESMGSTAQAGVPGEAATPGADVEALDADDVEAAPETQPSRSEAAQPMGEPRRERRANRGVEEGREERTEDGDAFDESTFTEGSLHIETTSGWAIVVHEGRRLGRTPLDATMPVGRQVLTIYPYGLEPGEQVSVRVEPRTRRQIRLEVGPE